MGIAVFLSLLLLAAHVLLNLWVASTVGTAARHAARTVAFAEVGSEGSARQLAVARARRELGRFGADATFDFENSSDPSSVTLRVRVTGLRLVPGLDQLIPTLTRVDERVVVGREAR
jgi:hypothetical protein